MAKTDDYLFTLDVCLRNLPANAHPAHAQRIRELKEMVQTRPVVKQDPEWLPEAIKKGLRACKVDHDDVEWMAYVILRYINK